MNYRAFILGLVLVMSTVSAVNVAYATDGNKPWQVRNLLTDGKAICDGGSWSYQITWAPIVYEGTRRTKYTVVGNGCESITYSCTAEGCVAQISKCSTRLSASWAGVTADIGKSVSGVRSPGIVKPSDCK